ncbi:MAG: FAD-binding oxidoreductase [Candidatus Omnitrophota bacterium]
MIIKKESDIIASYLEDYSNLSGGFCDSVAIPENENDVIELLKSASKSSSPVTITGAGTGVTGGRIPFGGISLSLEKLNKVLGIIKKDDGTGEAKIEAGVLLDDFLDIIEKQGFFYPPNPTEKGSSIGGNVATSASGARSFRFGTTRDFVLGLRIILSTGEIVDVNRGEVFADKELNLSLPLSSGKKINVKLPSYVIPPLKNAAGYYIKPGMDAVDLFIGSEGTLGVVTQIRVKLLKKPESFIECYVFFKEAESALEFVENARLLSKEDKNDSIKTINAISLEFYDRNSLNFLKQKHPDLPKDVSAAIYFEQEVNSSTEMLVIEAWSELIRRCGSSLDNTWFAQTQRERRRLQTIRHDLPDLVNEFMKRKGLSKVGTDIAVPDLRLNEMIDYYNTVLQDAGLRYIIFGHIGESHLHVNILTENQEQHYKAKELYELFIKKALSLGGTVSAEHGIGKIKHSYLELMYGKKVLIEMAELKKQLDPACILGLDNIFSKELLLKRP